MPSDIFTDIGLDLYYFLYYHFILFYTPWYVFTQKIKTAQILWRSGFLCLADKKDFNGVIEKNKTRSKPSLLGAASRCCVIITKKIFGKTSIKIRSRDIGSVLAARLAGWRRWRDSNSRNSFPFTWFPIMRPRPTRRHLHYMAETNIKNLFSYNIIIISQQPFVVNRFLKI